MSTEIVRLTPSVIINGRNFSDECLCVYGHVNRPTLFKRARCIECLHVWMRNLKTKHQLELHHYGGWSINPASKGCKTFCCAKASILWHDVAPRWQYRPSCHGVLAVEDDRGLMGAPVTCLLLCLSCPSSACDETMTAQSKRKLAPVNHKENRLWFSRSEGETTSPGTFSKWVWSKRNIVWRK